MMYLAYVKDIEEGVKADVTENLTIEFNSSKREAIGKIVFLENIRTTGFYKTKSRHVFKDDWLENLIEVNSDVFVAKFEHATIIVKKNADGHLLDVRSDSVVHACFIEDLITKEDLVENYSQTYSLTLFGVSQLKRKKCKVCNSMHRNVDVKTIDNDTAVCYECYTALESCSVCGLKSLSSANNTIAGKPVCESCYANTGECEDCGELYDKRKLNAPDVGRCEKCLRKTHAICSTCGVMYEKDGSEHLIRYPEDLDIITGKCDVCYIIEDRSSIKSYSHKPRIIKKQVKTGCYDNLLFGFEIEVGISESKYSSDVLATRVQQTANKRGKFIYCKSDSSINHGFEIVSHPVNYNWIEKNSDLVKSIMSMKDYGCSADDESSCGMHIHMSRSEFSPLQLYRFIKFLNYNKKFSCFMSERVSTRGGSGLSMPSYTKFIGGDEAIIKTVSRKGNLIERYSIVNLGNEHTVEVRMFQSTLNYETFMKNIQLCKALFEYSKYSTNTNDSNLDKFFEFVYKSGEYKHLEKRMRLYNKD